MPLTVKNSRCGRVKPDVKEIGDGTPKGVKISHRPIIESAVIVQVEAALVVQPLLESPQITVLYLVGVRLPERFYSLGGSSHRWSRFVVPAKC
jgi:hypothetical protein